MKLFCTYFSLFLLGASYASAQQSAAPTAAPQLETVMLVRLKPQTLVSSGASIAATNMTTQRWGELAAGNSSLRARLAAPLSIEPAFDVPGLQSRWLSSNPNDPVRQLARIVLLHYPSVVDAHLMHNRLSAMAEFEVVYNAQHSYKLAAIAAEPYLDPPAPAASDLWCNTAGTCLPRNPFAAAGGINQSESYGQWGMVKIGAANAWEKIGADRFDNNPGAGLYGSTNVAVIDYGIARGCDPFYGACSPSTPKYHPDLDANVRDGLSIGDRSTDVASGFYFNPAAEDALEFLESSAASTFLTPTTTRFEGGVVRTLTPPVPANSYVSSGHGSHVSGIIAARLNGSQGAGVCPSCSLAMYRSIGPSFTRMLQVAVNNGAQAINMSWTDEVNFPTAASSEEKNAPSALDALLNVGGARDIWMVASAGNNQIATQTQQPASNVNVIAAGGSDLVDNFWNETTLGNSNCPVGAINPTECGSNYPIGANASRFLVAPAARILSTMYTIWNSSRFASGTAACTPELFPDAASPSSPLFNANYGVCTGTSMSAPFITGAGALLRSANPLLSVQNMLSVFQATGSSIAGVPNAPTAKRINVDAALNQVYGSIGASGVENRIIPLFAARSVQRKVRINATDDILEPATDWLMSTKPQMLIEGGMGDLYYYRKNVTNSIEILQPRVGGRGNVYYDSPINLPTLSGYTSYPGTSNVAPRASAFIFATQRAPYSGAPDNLVPLYRLAMQGFCRGKKHVYSSGLIGSGAFAVSNLTTVGQKCTPTTNNSADPSVLTARFNLVSIEGFLFATAEAGTVPLKLKYSSAEQSYAVLTPADESRAEFAGYSNPASGEVILGYAYSNDTLSGNGLDTDTWPSGWELARGMNEQSNDGDCDGIADDAEYSLAGFPASDPMVGAGNCADMRIVKMVNSPIGYTVTNPIGPNAASSVLVTLSYAGTTNSAPGGPQWPVTPSGWKCTNTVTYGAQNSFQGTSVCSKISGGAFVTAENVYFRLPLLRTTEQPFQAAVSSSNDPAVGNNLAN